MKNLIILLLFILSGCVDSGDDLEPVSTYGGASVPTPVVNLSSGSSSPSYDKNPEFDITNLPFYGGSLWVAYGHGCSDGDLPDGVSGSISAVSSSTMRLYLSITNPGTYNFSAFFDTSDGQSQCTNFSYTLLEVPAPPVPTSISVTSPGYDFSPTITVGGLVAGSNVYVYSDSSCSNLLGSRYVYSDGTYTFYLNDLPSVGTYSLYAKSIKNGVSSSCSSTLATYQLNSYPAPTSFNKLSPVEASGISNMVEIEVGGIASGDFIELYNDITCSNKIGTSSYASSTSISLSSSPLSVGTYNFYVKRHNTSLDASSNCITTGITYQTLGNSRNNFVESQKTSANVGHGSFPIALGDVNNDGLTDMALLDYYSGYASISNGDGTFSSISLGNLCGSSGGCFLNLNDFNNDGYDDIIIISEYYGKLYYGEGNGDGTFNTLVTVKENGSWGYHDPSISSGDINNDGNKDIVIVDGIYSSTTNIEFHLGNGNGTFQTSVTQTLTGVDTSSNLVDIDGDNYLDLIITMASTDSIIVMKNNGDGTFATEVTYSTGSVPRDINVADVDNDGDLDLIYVNSGDKTVGVMKNNNDGTFASQIETSIGGKSRIHLSVGDFDGDSKVDVISTDKMGNMFSILYGVGDGTFTDIFHYSTGEADPYSVKVFDVDNDGDLDFTVLEEYTSGIQVYLNQ